MKCLILVPSLLRAGAEMQAVDLANGLASRGHAIHLCTFEPQMDQRSRISADVQFHHVRRRSRFDRSVIVGIADLLERLDIEVVQGVLEIATFFGWRAAERTLCKPLVVAAVHNTRNRGVKDEVVERLLYRRMLSRVSAVVFVCENQKRQWTAKYPELRRTARVVYNGVEPTQFRRAEFEESAKQFRFRLGISPAAFVFTSVAAFRQEKGHRLLIEAFGALPANTHLVLAGDGPLRPGIEAMVQAAALGGRVHFIGNVPDIRPVMVASDVTVLASQSETFSMAMLESMALGVPMIAPSIGGLPEAIRDGQTGVLFTAGSATHLASCMRACASGRLDIRQMGHAAREVVNQEFTREKMLAANESVLLELLAQRAAARTQ